MFPDQLIAADLAGLFLICTIYAFILDRHPDWYLPYGEWITVVIGNSFIVVALGILELLGVTLTTILVFLANGAAGAPIIIWQFIVAARQRAERATAKRRNHESEDSRRPGRA